MMYKVGDRVVVKDGSKSPAFGINGDIYISFVRNKISIVSGVDNSGYLLNHFQGIGFYESDIDHEATAKLNAFTPQMPSWDDAPEWAEWLAMDKDGRWFWYKIKPYTGSVVCAWQTACKSERHYFKNWQESLQQRPQPTEKQKLEKQIEEAKKNLAELENKLREVE